MLVYLGFGLLAMHWLPILILCAFLVFVWIPNMLWKDKSLSRYIEFEAYKQRSKLFTPFLWWIHGIDISPVKSNDRTIATFYFG